jgi:hypothetical protein
MSTCTATLNGTFLRPHAPAHEITPEQVQAAWRKLNRHQRRAFVRSVGERSAVRVFGLSIADVALALVSPWSFEDSLARVLEAVS